MPIGVMMRLVCGRFAAVETWYSRSAGDVEAGITPGLLLCRARAGPLASNCYIEGYRVFNSAVRYDVRNISLIGPATPGELGIVGGQPATASNRADIQSTSLMCKVYGIVGGRNRVGNRELFGIPDVVDITGDNGQRLYAPTAAFITAFDAWKARLAGDWSFRVLTISPRHGIQALVVDAAPPGYLGVRADLSGDGLIAPTKRVRIRNSKRITTMQTLNGVWTVARVDPPVAPSTLSTVYLLQSAGYDPSAYDPLGTIEGIDYTYCPVADYVPQRPMGRKRGGRSGLSRGRSLARSH